MANNTLGNFTEYLLEEKVGILIWKIFPPVMIVLGTVGNSLSIIVLTRKSIRSSTTAVYLTVLAFSDLIVLYAGLLRQWIIYLFDVDIRKLTEFGCKINIWLVYSSLHFSAWILIVLTMERVISAWLPHKARTLCKRKSAIALVNCLGVFILGLNSHMLYGMVFKYSFDDDGNLQYAKCVEIDENYDVFFNKTWPWIDFCAFCFIPFSVILIGNALILIKVLASRRKVISQVVPIRKDGRDHLAGRKTKQASMPVLLFTLNIVYLLSTSPVSIYNIGYTFWIKNANQQETAVLDLWLAVVNIFMYVNNSLNFFLYCLSGTKFRREVRRIICVWRQGKGIRSKQGAVNYDNTRRTLTARSPKHSIFTTRNSQIQHQSNMRESN
ncbi:C-C chemokine receptor type 1-like [Ruditapes philippinarum]|uniref:C-C chemokine receptor type 1-like n=1 Tax=Ruditapes philippinarum TaxID=129788 RepID=UPI00295BFAA8|nr:C-C chemokine receptor type 1-like [Ruditapes philippinarum]